MANKVRFLSTEDDILKTATITATSNTFGLPPQNVQNDLIRKVYRTTGKERESITFEVSGGTASINVVNISNISVTKNATILFKGAIGDFEPFWHAAPLSVTLHMATDGAGNPIRKITHFFDSTQSYPYYRLEFQDSGNPSTNIDIGRVMAGMYTEPQQNLREGFSLTKVDPSRYTPVKGRQGYANVRRRFTQLSYSVSFMPESQQDEIVGLFEKVGKYAPLMISLDPETKPSHNTFYAQIQSDNISFSHRFGNEFDLNEVVFEEKN